MDHEAQTFPAAAQAGATLPKVSVRIQGLPEDVQRIADAIDSALSSAMEWQSCAHDEADCLIEVNGQSETYV